MQGVSLDDFIWLKPLAKALILPPTGPLLVAAFGLWLRRYRPRTGSALAVLGVATLLALSVPVVASLLMRPLDVAGVLDLQRARNAQAIVILGGGTRPDAVEYGGDTVGRLTLERVRYGARVARETGLPVLVTGGALATQAAEADLMRDVLQREYGVPVRWVEPRSRNTHENALFSARILKAEGIGRVVLVAHALDMRRAIAEFTAAGLDVVPAPTLIPQYEYDEVLDYVPSLGGLAGSYYATYELLAIAVRAVTAMAR